MKYKLIQIIKNSLSKAYQKGYLSSNDHPQIAIEEPKLEAHGDFSCNIAMISASVQKMAPRKIAEAVVKNLNDPDEIVSDIQIAGPGFINFFISTSAWYPILNIIHKQDMNYGASDFGAGKKVMVEFISANPTGPLHVGHGRGAAVGDALSNILCFCGFDVSREYYINDSGRQIRTLGLSVFLRCLEQCGNETAKFPEDCYQGDYIKELASAIIEKKGKSFINTNKEEVIAFCARFAADNILAGIKEDLHIFGIKFDTWFSEQSLFDKGKVESVMQQFQENGLIYEKDGAMWFCTSKFGDEKDRVVIRQNGLTTYFASDIAYHQNKFERGFDRLIDVWGADHHGYIPRIKASIEASGHDKNQFMVVLVQLVNLLRAGEPVAMSTRAGEFITLRDVINEVGSDAARFIFLMRHYDSPLDFDLELAKKQTNENPVYYVQYVHARISSIVRKAEKEAAHILDCNDNLLTNLKEIEEIRLLKAISFYPDAVKNSAINIEPHRITYYLMNLASLFHSYYNKHRVLIDENSLASARLYLIRGVQKVIKNGLTLLGVSAPERM
ncbi:Arginine--tRNA ligase [Candidatus Magnetomoraceae bacterium gMMP-1]